MFDGLFQPSHLLVILIICLFIFGPKKLPELGQGLGKGIRSFRDSMKQATTDETEKPAGANTDNSNTETAARR